MNEQFPPNGIEWTRRKVVENGKVVKTLRGFTWNYVSGCVHDCKWKMPDGTTAICYAKELAERLKSPHFFPNGFEDIHAHPKRLREPFNLKEPAGIFIDSMSDMFSVYTPATYRDDLIRIMYEAYWHTYFSLTKNPSGYRWFADNDVLPLNLWPGISSPPDFMYGKKLSQSGKEKFLRNSLKQLSMIRWRGYITWISFEPLNWDVSDIVREYPGALHWAVIGAASSGKKYHAPEETYVRKLVEVLDEFHVPVFFKGNLRSLKWAAQNWREDFPDVSKIQQSEEHTDSVEIALDTFR